VRQPLDVGEEVAGMVDFYEPVAAEAGVRLVGHTEPGAVLAADRTMLQRALANLLTNAIAFTPSGGSITVTLRRPHGGIEIEVADTGRGIKRELANGLLASPYSFRTDDAGSSVRTGLGIGLTIVQSVMRLHDGAVTIDSDEGKGCRVTLRFAAPALATVSQ
jgi:two-component system heavy metal sensor histidine kinase CusS